MEPVKILASGLTLEESKAKRQEKQAARYRHRLGTYVPSGDSKGLLEALKAASPKKSPKKPTASGSTRPRKSLKHSTKGRSGNETVDESTQETDTQTKAKKSTSRKSTKAADSSEKVTGAERGEKGASMGSTSKARANTVEDDDGAGSRPSMSRRTNKSTRTAKPKATRSSKKSTTTRKPKLPKVSSHGTHTEDDLDDRPITPEPVQRRSKKLSAKPPPTQTDDENDGLAIKGAKAAKTADKGKTRTMEDSPEIFGCAGTDVDLGDSRPGPSKMKLLSAEEKALRDAPPDVYETVVAPIISRVAFDGGDISGDDEQEQQQRKPPPKKRGRPRKDKVEGEPLSKRGKRQGVDGGGEVNGPTKSKPKQQAKTSSPKPKSTATKERTRKKANPPSDTADEGKERGILSDTEPSGSNTRKRQRRTSEDGSYDEKADGPDGDEPDPYPNRVRLDSIPPEGVVLRRKNGIVEKLLPPATKPKRKAPGIKGKTRGSRKRAIPAHVLKYIGPTRFGSPLKAEGTDTDDDLNL